MNTSGPHYLDGFQASTGGFRPANRLASISDAAPLALCWEEQVKRALPPFDAFPRLLAGARTDQPPPADDRFRFQWLGVFYQGPAVDACVVRLRLPGGRIKGFQWLGLAEIVQELAGGCVEPNVQGGLDIPGVPWRGCAEVLRRVEGLGLSARGTGGDCVQAVRGGEREEAAPAELPPVYRLVCELEQALAQGREFGDLPGPCEIVFRAADEPAADDPAAANAAPRLVFRAFHPAPDKTARPEGWPRDPAAGQPAWRVRLPDGGDLGVALTAAETLPACLALLRVWSRLADRSDRGQAAWGSFCARLGAGELRAALERELGRSLARPPAVEAAAGPADVSSPRLAAVSRLLSGQMAALARLATRLGVDELRLIPPGCLWVPPGVDAAAFEAILHPTTVPGAEA